VPGWPVPTTAIVWRDIEDPGYQYLLSIFVELEVVLVQLPEDPEASFR
jgi:hypothetical protein